MQSIDSLYNFFVRTGAEVRLYHLGRRVEPCPLESLCALEHDAAAWPAPWQNQARFALMFRIGDLEDPLIWFLALPLDEQGQLDPAARDAFLQRLLETIGRNVEGLGREDSRPIDNLMKDNPLAFTPSTNFQAMLHARASHDFERPASQHLEPVEAYLTGQQIVDWRALGLQGLADFAVRMDDASQHQVAHSIATLPSEMLVSLCYCLEHVGIADTLAESLRQRGERAAADGDVETFCACVRAVSGADESLVGEWYDSLLDDEQACGPDLLAAMAGRGWQHLEHARRLPRFLTRLAKEPRADFAAVARDLALIPRLRLPVLMTLREADPASPIGRRLAHLSR
ncbi:DUF3549 family protein [Halomonas sp. 18H]|uniref:DUF3549 family protein n=1 Tax=Halomonas almeriensis TaxID=308163 RepID=UPI002231A081|nr:MULTISPECIES: DUF3549 family protein [Halomonas]MCW4151523.1 DUF3549 family protein [Halomonas sp. 18H]MDN3552669.1 DUF3549 family protein [Halomonas almeriensis]